jgi:hypothetical protein
MGYRESPGMPFLFKEPLDPRSSRAFLMRADKQSGKRPSRLRPGCWVPWFCDQKHSFLFCRPASRDFPEARFLNRARKPQPRPEWTAAQSQNSNSAINFKSRRSVVRSSGVSSFRSLSSAAILAWIRRFLYRWPLGVNLT